MASDPECIFCRIVKGEIPCAKVYEDENYMAFLDISPVNKGHTLIIPKGHYEDLLNTPDEVLCGMLADTKKIAKAVLKAVGAKAFNVSINVGKGSGQLVPHLHIHIMPRFPGDGHHLFKQGSYAEGEIQKVADDIKKELTSSSK